MGNIELSKRLTEQVQETLRDPSNTNDISSHLSAILDEKGGVQNLSAQERGLLVKTLRGLSRAREGVTEEFRMQARNLAVLVDREEFIQEFTDHSVPDSSLKRWTKRAGILLGGLGVAAAGGVGATLIGADNLGVAANKIGEGAGWAWDNLVPSGDSTLSFLTHPATAYGVGATAVVGAGASIFLSNKKEPVQAEKSMEKKKKKKKGNPDKQERPDNRLPSSEDAQRTDRQGRSTPISSEEPLVGQRPLSPPPPDQEGPRRRQRRSRW